MISACAERSPRIYGVSRSTIFAQIRLPRHRAFTSVPRVAQVILERIWADATLNDPLREMMASSTGLHAAAMLALESTARRVVLPGLARSGSSQTMMNGQSAPRARPGAPPEISGSQSRAPLGAQCPLRRSQSAS